MRIHEKRITKQEIDIIDSLYELSLEKCTLIKTVHGDILEEYEGKHIGRTQWNILKFYYEVLKPLYSVCSDKFSEGIYSFWGAYHEKKSNDYRVYILEELNQILDLSKKSKIGDIKESSSNTVRTFLNEMILKEEKIDSFSLLHGDLYNGNILIYKNKYALIDFEYVRFGPPLLEWSFLLFWDAIMELVPCRRELLFDSVYQNIETLKSNDILLNKDLNLIFNLYLPLIICNSLQYCEEGRYESNRNVSDGLCIFWRDEYECIKDKLI